MILGNGGPLVTSDGAANWVIPAGGGPSEIGGVEAYDPILQTQPSPDFPFSFHTEFQSKEPALLDGFTNIGLQEWEHGHGMEWIPIRKHCSYSAL